MSQHRVSDLASEGAETNTDSSNPPILTDYKKRIESLFNKAVYQKYLKISYVEKRLAALTHREES